MAQETVGLGNHRIETRRGVKKTWRDDKWIATCAGNTKEPTDARSAGESSVSSALKTRSAPIAPIADDNISSPFGESAFDALFGLGGCGRGCIW